MVRRCKPMPRRRSRQDRQPIPAPKAGVYKHYERLFIIGSETSQDSNDSGHTVLLSYTFDNIWHNLTVSEFPKFTSFIVLPCGNI